MGRPLKHEFDAVIVGAGGAGLYAALEASRDEGIGPRLDVLDDVHGVWPCENHFQCTRVCPRGIKVTKNINLVKRQIKAFKEQSNQNT